MTSQARTYRAVCFDLDGTLLPMDLDAFMVGYFGALAHFIGEKGLDAESFMVGLKAGTKAMAVSPESVTNEQAFWDLMFKDYIDRDERDWHAFMDEFYATVFPAVGKGVVADPAAAMAVANLKAKGYPVLLTTMPMFPPRAVAERLQWAGLDVADFARVTTYDNSRAVKPRLTYYAENLAAMDVRGEDVLMVGNNTVEDLAFMKLGVDAFLVTDHLIDPLDYDMDTIKNGSMADFAAWVETLPPCDNPALGPQGEGILTGAIALDVAQAALAANLVGEHDAESEVRAAASVVDDPTYARARGGESEVPNVSDAEVQAFAADVASDGLVAANDEEGES